MAYSQLYYDLKLLFLLQMALFNNLQGEITIITLFKHNGANYSPLFCSHANTYPNSQRVHTQYTNQAALC